MKLVYGVNDKPAWGKTLVFALQQLLAIMAATIAVPMIINNTVGSELSTSAALFGAGVGTLVYLLFTKFRSPVFLGSSFAFLGSMGAAFVGASSMVVGYLGIILGAIFAGLVYVIIAIIVKLCGTAWINKVMPAVVIGPTVAIIGLSLAGNAVGDIIKDGDMTNMTSLVSVIVGLVTLAATMVASIYGTKMMKLIPFIIGIGCGYIVALIFTGFSYIPGAEAIRIIDFDIFRNAGWDKFVGGWCPDFTFIKAIDAFKEDVAWGPYIATVAVAFIPVAFVVFAEHLADHKNLSTVIESDLLENPGLHRTLLGDGVGSMAGAFFGGACNTTYGESVGCVAISGNASVRTIFTTAILAILLSFILPFSTLLASIPSCVMGGVCVALYGFIAVSGLKMIQKSDLNDNRNLFTVSVVLISGIGGFFLTFGKISLTSVACALILGILTNLLVNIKTKKNNEPDNGEKTLG